MGENRQEFYQRQALYTEKKDHADVHGLNADATANGITNSPIIKIASSIHNLSILFSTKTYS